MDDESEVWTMFTGYDLFGCKVESCRAIGNDRHRAFPISWRRHLTQACITTPCLYHSAMATHLQYNHTQVARTLLIILNHNRRELVSQSSRVLVRCLLAGWYHVIELVNHRIRGPLVAVQQGAYDRKANAIESVVLRDQGIEEGDVLLGRLK